MAKPEGKFHKKMMDEGYCDDRGVVFCATATSLPNGEYGIVLLALHGDILSIYDVLDMHNTIGDRLYEIPLQKMDDFQMAASFLGEMTHGYAFRFTYCGVVCSFKNCFPMKQMIQTIADAAAEA